MTKQGGNGTNGRTDVSYDFARALKAMDRDYRPLCKKAFEAGWGFLMRGGAHVILVPADPTMRLIPVPSSGGDVRGIKNFKRDLRHSGLEV